MELHFLYYSIKKIQHSDLELLRKWRNEDVLEFMINKEYISTEMQLKWFESIDNIYNFFFIIMKGNEQIGLIDVKNIDWLSGNADTGIFIANPTYRESEVPIAATVLSAVFISKILKLKTIHGIVHSENKRAINFNLSTGFKITSEHDNLVEMSIENIEQSLTIINKLKNKLIVLSKQNENKDIILFISKKSAQNDNSVKWLIQNKIKKHAEFKR